MKQKMEWKSVKAFVETVPDYMIQFTYYNNSFLLSMPNQSARIEDVTLEKYKEIAEKGDECSSEEDFNELMEHITALSISNPCFTKYQKGTSVIPEFWEVTPLGCIHCSHKGKFRNIERYSRPIKIRCSICGGKMNIRIRWCEFCCGHQPSLRMDDEGEGESKYQCICCDNE